MGLFGTLGHHLHLVCVLLFLADVLELRSLLESLVRVGSQRARNHGGLRQALHDILDALASKQNQCWSVPSWNIHHERPEELKPPPQKKNRKEAQRQVLYQKRLYCSVQTSRSPKLTIHKVRKPRKFSS